jgi:DNA repair exonuclease SbcCD ATPase subunit
MREQLDGDKGRKRLLEEQLEAAETRVSSAQANAEALTQVRSLFESLTDKKREMVRSKIEALVTHGIQAVFGPDYAFAIEQKTARNQVTFNYRILQKEGDEWVATDLRGYHGGGLVAMVGFLLRLVMVLFTHPPRRRILWLDETFANLDADKRDPLAKLLQSLGKELKCQFVMITHSPEYIDEADKAYEIRRVGDSAQLMTVD